MRSKSMARTLVTATVICAVGAGGLVTAGTAVAAPSGKQQAVASESVAPLAVVNLGLTSAEAQKVQRWLRTYFNYNGAIDGQLGTESWKAMQRFLRQQAGYTDAIDGIVGPNTIRALQYWLRQANGYTGAIDGIAGAGTQAAFKRFANGLG
ncbi:peptidoglycan-binding protein [Streptomyces xiamenensis]|jgi:peptidoglycan hydrolase-like protein with peptidoglycan-binding domain|uniref:peptidoglycan-binding protein n=1 Tax=Streptomyces xiamenensis TaxID=408015 RepID=UPI0037D7F87D